MLPFVLYVMQQKYRDEFIFNLTKGSLAHSIPLLHLLQQQ